MLDIKLLDHERPDLATLPIHMWFDNSRLEAFAKCPRYGWYSDVLGLDSSNAKMNAGTIMHHAIEQGKEGKNSEIELVREWEKYKASFQNAPEFTVNRFTQVLSAYEEKWRSQPIISLAREFRLAWYFRTDDFWLVGRCDEIIYHEGKFWPLERKTCGGIRPDYIGDKNVSNQRLQYLWILSWILKSKGLEPRDFLGGIMFDVIGWNKSKIDFARWPVKLPNQNVFSEWFEEVRETIANYRVSYAKADSGIKLPNKRRAQCYIYGKCAFLDLCNAWELTDSFDPPSLVNNFRKKTWRPI